METATESKTPTVAPPTIKDQIGEMLDKEPHRPVTAEDLLTPLKMQSPKDPQKQAQAVERISTELRRLVQEGRAVETAPGSFKARLFFDKEQWIEHAYLGGMGNVHYRFRSPIFRLNIGVLSVFFSRDGKRGDWGLMVRDATIGKDYGLARRLSDGTYTFGSRPAGAGEDRFIQIPGRYIAKEHVTLTISGEEVRLEDHLTQHGTRIDLLTPEGLAKYRKAAEAFIKSTDPKNQKDNVKRGRFALEQLLQHHQNFENSFFNTVADWLLEGGASPS
jgi:hypothetical protein